MANYMLNNWLILPVLMMRKAMSRLTGLAVQWAMLCPSDLPNDTSISVDTSLGTTTLWPAQVFYKYFCADQNLSLQVAGINFTVNK